MLRKIFFLICFSFMAAGLSAQEVTSQGVGVGKTEAEAVSLAKANALSSAFKSMAKDVLYQNLYIQDPLLYAMTAFVNVKVEKQSSDRFQATLTVKLDSITLNTATSKYIEAVSAILNDTEKEIDALEKLLIEAKKAMDSTRYQDAYKAFREAKSRAESQGASLEKFTDPSVRSDKGNPKPVLEQGIKSRLDRASDGLARLEIIEKQGRDETALKDLSNAFTQWETKQIEIGQYSRALLPSAPFYDWPKADLEKRLVETKTRISLQKDIHQEMERISKAVPSSAVLFQSRIRLTITSGEENLNVLEKLAQDLDKEIQDPRIERVERERQGKVFWKGVGEFLLFRESKENFSVKANFPMGYSNYEFRWTGPDLIEAKLEGGFWGIWGKTSLRYQTEALSGKDTLVSINQDAALAFGQSSTWGAGVAWEWFQGVESPTNFLAMWPSWKVLLNCGQMDQEKGWHLWQLTGAYRVPQTFGQVINLKVDGLVRIGPYAKAEGTFLYDNIPHGDTNNLDSVLGYSLGAGIKIPNPFLWGLKFENRGVGPQGKTMVWNGSWRLYLEYSF